MYSILGSWIHSQFCWHSRCAKLMFSFHLHLTEWLLPVCTVLFCHTMTTPCRLKYNHSQLCSLSYLQLRTLCSKVNNVLFFFVCLSNINVICKNINLLMIYFISFQNPTFNLNRVFCYDLFPIHILNVAYVM